MSLPLQGKIALVTGGTRGIGRAIVEALAEAGAIVEFSYKSSTQSAEEVTSSVAAAGGTASGHQADGASTKESAALVEAVIAKHKRIDILVNNAGITKDMLLMRMGEEDWDNVINSNLKSVFNFTKATCRQMMSQRAGKIVNISSIIGIMGNAGQSNYAASKAGIIGFSKSIAKELASRNIQVNVVAPGFVDTDMTGALTADQKKAITDIIPLKRTARPAEIAAVVRFLATSDADYITGQVISVDGGMNM